MRLSKPQRIILGFTIFMFTFWMCLFATHSIHGRINDIYSLLVCFVPMFGGVILIKSGISTRLSGHISKGLFFIGLGVMFWGLGGVVWAYYNFTKDILAPYPSLADLFYLSSVFLYNIGMLYLASAAGINPARMSTAKKSFLITFPILIFILIYSVFLPLQYSSQLLQPRTLLRKILDIIYPLGDATSLTSCIFIIGFYFKFLIEKYKKALYLIFSGLFLMLFGDLLFTYTLTRGAYYNGGYSDIVFTISIFLITFGSLYFHTGKNETLDGKIHFFNFLLYS